MAVADRHVARDEVEEFFVEEAALLDAWELDAWLKLFAEDGVYLVPALDQPALGPQDSLYLIMDDNRRLRSRVRQLLGRSMWAENPPSRTRRIVSNIRILGQEGDRVRVEANFAVYRMRHRTVDLYVGRYLHILEATANGLRFVERKTVLDNEALSPQGKISIIL